LKRNRVQLLEGSDGKLGPAPEESAYVWDAKRNWNMSRAPRAARWNALIVAPPWHENFNLNWAIFYSIRADLLRIKASQKFSTYPRVCLRFFQILMHQYLSTYLRKKSLNLGYSYVSSLVHL
jgi:hypothetical protein